MPRNSSSSQIAGVEGSGGAEGFVEALERLEVPRRRGPDGVLKLEKTEAGDPVGGARGERQCRQPARNATEAESRAPGRRHQGEGHEPGNREAQLGRGECGAEAQVQPGQDCGHDHPHEDPPEDDHDRRQKSGESGSRNGPFLAHGSGIIGVLSLTHRRGDE